MRKTACGHFFHATCLQHITTNASSNARRCPMCRHQLDREGGARPPAISTQSGAASGPFADHGRFGYDQQEAHYFRG